MARKKKKTMGWKGRMALAMLVILGVIFSSTSVIFIVGMLPTVVAVFIDRTRQKLKALTVGAMNLAGCFPFVLELWVLENHNLYTAIEKISEPRTIVVIYLAALIGYLIDWAMTGIVASIMVQKGKLRLNEIEKIQESLIERWGPEVRGNIPLDEYGFPIDQEGVNALEQAHTKAPKAQGA